MGTAGASARLRYGSTRSWWALTAGVAALGALEVAVGVLLTHRLLPDPWAGWVDAVLVGATTALLVVVASPLLGRLTVDSGHLTVGFGLLGSIRVPLDQVSGVEVEASGALPAVPIGLDVVARGDRSVLTVSRGRGRGRLVLRLAGGQVARVQVVRRTPVTDVVVVMDDPRGACDVVQGLSSARTAGGAGA